MHTDESHIHLHAYGLHPSAHADSLHPGKTAKKQAVDAALDAGHDKRTSNAIGDRAYVEAMRDWQDSYSLKVALAHGLTRLGPARRRLSRAEWKAEQAAATSVQEARRRAEGAMSEANAAEGIRDRILSEAQQKAGLAALERRRLLDEATRNAKTLAGEARRERDRILTDARRDLGRLSSFGVMLRAFWDSLRKSAIRSAVQREVQNLIDKEAARAASALRRLRDETLRRTVAEARLADATQSARVLGRERDRLRRERDRRLEESAIASPARQPNYR